MMKPRGKRGLSIESNLKLPAVFLLCLCFFLAGLFGSVIISQDNNWGIVRHILLEESVYESGKSIVHGESGESSITSIPFQAHLSVQMKTVPEFWSLLRGKLLELQCYQEAMERSFLSYLRVMRHVTILEAFNVLRYEVGQRYVSHYDSFNPAEYGPQKSQRIASFLLYLSDVEEGGETTFPFENGENMDIGYDYESCIGLKVKPRQGDGVLFYSLSPNGTIDKTSLHGSCPVVKGEKWVATKWIRDNKLSM